jgi:cytoskeletal protein RodZ
MAMRTAAFAIALLLSGAAFAQTSTTTTQPDADVDAHVGTQPDGDPDVDLDVDLGTRSKTTTQNADGTVTTTGTSTTDGASDGTMTTDTMATDTMSTDTMATGTTTLAMNPVVQPSNASPERDARGIAVISDPAMVPAGFNGTTGTGVGGPMVDPATGETMAGADTSYPACTATVTDNCLQTYERGRR